MSDQLLTVLESKLDQLITECSRLSRENTTLQQQLDDVKNQQNDWHNERKRLIEKNELAKTRVEAMITRLKSLEEQN